jgi:hypothetical protein
MNNNKIENGAKVVLYAVGSIVRLKKEVEQEKEAHRGKHFKVIGYAGRFLELQWQEQKVLFLPNEVDLLSNGI